MLDGLRRLWRRMRLLGQLGDHERAMEEEMRFHVEMQAAELERAGILSPEARRQARLAFGSVERFKEEGRDTRGTRLVEDLCQDLRYAVRQLRASPGFALATILTLALGIGAATAMHTYSRYLTAAEAALPEAERLVIIGQGARGCSDCDGIAAANYETIRDQARSFERVALLDEWETVFRGEAQAELVNAARVTPEYFETLRIQPILGRTFTPADATAATEPVVILGESVWRTRFGADSEVLSRTVVLDRVSYAIVGVVQDAPVYPRDVTLWTPLVLGPEDTSDRTTAGYRMIGRLRGQIGPAQASTEIEGLAATLAIDFPALQQLAFTVRPVLDRRGLYGDPIMWAYTGGGAIVLLVAWVNLAGLLIARLVARRRELAVRRAIGAPAERVVRQLLTEVVLVTGIGGALGALIAVFAVRALAGSSDVPLDGYAFATSLAIGVLSGATIAALPSLRFTRPPLATELCGSAKAVGSIDRARGRRALVVVQVALTIVLLAAAGVLTRSFRNIYDVRLGFDSDRVLALRLWAPAPADDSNPTTFGEVARAVQSLRGVENAGAALGLPFGHGAGDGRVEVVGGLPTDPEDRVVTSRLQAATPDFFATLGIPLLRGRAFAETDVAESPPVAVVNEAFVDQYLGGSNGLGRELLIDDLRWEIVGVTSTVFYGDVEEVESPEVYRPMTQFGGSNAWLVVRAGGNPGQLGGDVGDAVRRVDPDIVVTRVETIDALRSSDMSSERRALRIMGGFGLAALMIAVIGLYGLVSYSVAQRTREFGVRLALGARSSRVMALVLGEGLRLAVFGALLGLALALAALRVLRSLLFGVSPVDPLTLATVVLGIGAIALLAALLPARRAMLSDPIRALREE